MQINPIQNYNKIQTKNNPSFGNIRCTSKIPRLFRTYGDADHFYKYINDMAKVPVELRYLIKTKDMSPKAIKILEEFYKKIGEQEVQDFTVTFDYNSRFSINTGAGFNSDLYPIYEFLVPAVDKKNSIFVKHVRRILAEPHTYSHFFLRSHKINMEDSFINFNRTGKVYFDSRYYILNKVAAIIKDAVIDIAEHNEEKPIQAPQLETLPVASVVCTVDDINNYLAEHVTEIDEGNIFNVPVTKDGESLLIALVHALPDKDNTEKYIKLVNNMSKMPNIDYNQKDAVDIPAIAHVLNSQNKILFAAFANCKYLKYEPSLEFEFNSIRDPEFRELVLKSRIFENKLNIEYPTIFGQPNPIYMG